MPRDTIPDVKPTDAQRKASLYLSLVELANNTDGLDIFKGFLNNNEYVGLPSGLDVRNQTLKQDLIGLNNQGRENMLANAPYMQAYFRAMYGIALAGLKGILPYNNAIEFPKGGLTYDPTELAQAQGKVKLYLSKIEHNTSPLSNNNAWIKIGDLDDIIIDIQNLQARTNVWTATTSGTTITLTPPSNFTDYSAVATNGFTISFIADANAVGYASGSYTLSIHGTNYALYTNWTSTPSPTNLWKTGQMVEVYYSSRQHNFRLRSVDWIDPLVQRYNNTQAWIVEQGEFYSNRDTNNTYVEGYYLRYSNNIIDVWGYIGNGAGDGGIEITTTDASIPFTLPISLTATKGSVFFGTLNSNHYALTGSAILSPTQAELWFEVWGSPSYNKMPMRFRYIGTRNIPVQS